MPSHKKKKARVDPPPLPPVTVPTDGSISKLYPDLLGEKMPDEFVSMRAWDKLETFIALVYHDESRHPMHTIVRNRDAEEEEEEEEEDIRIEVDDDEKSKLVPPRQHEWFMPKFLHNPTTPEDSAFEPDTRSKTQRETIKNELIVEVLGKEWMSHACVLYPSKHNQRLLFYLGTMILASAISAVMLGLFSGGHLGRVHVSFTFGQFESMWGNSPLGRRWNARLVSLVTLPVLCLLFSITFGYFYRNSDNTDPDEEHGHERMFWVAISLIQGWWALMAAISLGQTELLGMIATFVLVSTTFLIYSNMHCYVDRALKIAHHLLCLIPAIVFLIAICNAGVGTFDLAVGIIWLVAFLLSHIAFSCVVYQEKRMHYTHAQRYGDIFIDYFLHQADRWLRGRSPEHILRCGIMFDSDRSHVMTGESYDNWLDESFIRRYFEQPSANSTNAVVSGLGGGPHARPVNQRSLSVHTSRSDEDFDKRFQWRRTLRSAIVVMFAAHAIGLLTMVVLPLTNASTWAHIGMQRDQEIISIGKWPVAYFAWSGICVAVLIGCYRIYADFEWYMKETFFHHGICAHRFGMLAFVDATMMLLVIQSLGVTDCTEVVFFSASLLAANLFLCVYNEAHDWYFWAFCCKLLPWIGVLVRAFAIDGSLDPDRSSKLFVALFAVIGHGLEIGGQFFVVCTSSSSSSKNNIDWWGVLELSWIVLRSSLHVLVFSTVLSTNILIAN